MTISINNSSSTISEGSNTDETYFTVDWETTVGGSSFEIVHTVIKANDGGYIVAGRTESYGAGGSDAYVVKVDANGNLLWNKSYGGADYEVIWKMTDTGDGNFMLVGETKSFGAGHRDVWLLKMDTDGNILWNKTFGLADADWGINLVRSGDNFYVTGTYHPIIDGFSELLLLKVDQDGNFLWNKSFGGGRGYDIISVDNNGVLISGHTGDDDSVILRVDDQGNELWRKTYGGAKIDEADGVTSTPDGGFLIGGHTQSFGSGGSDAWFIKVDKNGNHEWNKTFGGVFNDFAGPILNHQDGGYLVTMHTFSYGPGNGDNWIMKLDETGNKEWEQFTGYSDGDDFAWDMIEVANNKYVLAGLTEVDGTNSDVWIFQITLKDSESSTPTSPGFMLLSIITIPIVSLLRRKKIS
jgi:predicted secreted protein